GATRAEALHLLAVVRLHDDSYLESAGYLQQALGEAGAELGLRVRILIQLLFVLVNLGRIPDALELTSGSMADAERLGDPRLLAKALAAFRHDPLPQRSRARRAHPAARPRPRRPR